ncbi:unnamed protein product [Vitrella brassicaformis CCMP3155]|uniref:Uncharacterized protein n=1 Tax=Vitrella brassicaformis (strain CCMP3155) TaxID=1169540 RepID=A0A0G4H0S9_VITBC|nr:unnamed protein product [Vitrella brassicaformis CCMP3155]|eukprot:CEM36942.1 unnamed protein product [Vitrella brassicaformis CCMP3155]
MKSRKTKTTAKSGKKETERGICRFVSCRCGQGEGPLDRYAEERSSELRRLNHHTSTYISWHPDGRWQICVRHDGKARYAAIRPILHPRSHRRGPRGGRRQAQQIARDHGLPTHPMTPMELS